MAFGVAPGKRRQQEEQHAAEQHASDGQKCFDFPVESKPWKLGILILNRFRFRADRRESAVFRTARAGTERTLPSWLNSVGFGQFGFGNSDSSFYGQSQAYACNPGSRYVTPKKVNITTANPRIAK